MIPVTITASRQGRWWRRTRVVTWKRQLPEHWEDVPVRRRRHYCRLLLSENGVRRVAQHLLRLPAWAIRALSPNQVAALEKALAWMQPKPDCVHLPFPSFRHHGQVYHLPKPKGENLTCIEYPMADEYFTEFLEQERDSALLLLCATICREENTDMAVVLRKDDPRIPLHSRAEVRDRAERLRGLPAEYQNAVLLYFAGLKEYINRTYGPWLFDDEDDGEEPQEEPTPDPKKPAQKGPDFGWWGIYQDVAEAGLFGHIEQVYQTAFHDVGMWLVRKQVQADTMRINTTPTNTKKHDDL